MQKFISSIMKDNFKQLESENIKKIYNNDFDVLIYNVRNKLNTIVVDKRDTKTIVYNNLEIAAHHITKKHSI